MAESRNKALVGSMDESAETMPACWFLLRLWHGKLLTVKVTIILALTINIYSYIGWKCWMNIKKLDKNMCLPVINNHNLQIIFLLSLTICIFCICMLKTVYPAFFISFMDLLLRAALHHHLTVTQHFLDDFLF